MFEFTQRFYVRILALILARGGSKRLPGKNIRMLHGKPLIVWSIDAAKDIGEIGDILVSTDDAAIADVCKNAGAYVPWLRPPTLATDTATSVDAAIQALDWYEAEKGVVDGVLLLQPTSPLRSKETIRKGIELFRNNGHSSVLGVSLANEHPMWTLKMAGDHLVPFMNEHGLKMRSQDLPDAYIVNGSFYMIRPDELRSCRSFVGERPTPLVIASPQEAIDIDTEWDFMVAELAADTILGQQ